MVGICDCVINTFACSYIQSILYCVFININVLTFLTELSIKPINAGTYKLVDLVDTDTLMLAWLTGTFIYI